MKNILIAFFFAVFSTMASAGIISEYTLGQSQSHDETTPGYYWGLSIYFDDQQDIIGWNELSVSLFDVNGETAFGDLYAFTTPQNTRASDLSTSNPFAIGTATSGAWQFGGNNLFSTNQVYHFYSDYFFTQPLLGFGGDAQSNEGFWYAADAEEYAGVPGTTPESNAQAEYFQLEPNYFINHRVQGSEVQSSVAVPEPSSVLMLSLALLGLGLNTRRKNVQIGKF